MFQPSKRIHFDFYNEWLPEELAELGFNPPRGFISISTRKAVWRRELLDRVSTLQEDSFRFLP